MLQIPHPSKTAAAILLLAFALSACETGHMWSMYSLGFTKRDAYLDNLADARDTLSDIYASLLPVAESDQMLEKAQIKAMHAADESLQLMQKQLATSNRIGKDWLLQWRDRPEKFQSDAFAYDTVNRERKLLMSQADEIIAQLHAQIKRPKRVDRPVLVSHLTAAKAWIDSVNNHVQWLESSDTGYPASTALEQ